jgi:DnaA-homolog protein
VNERPLSAPAAQLPLSLRFPPDQRFDTFVAAPAGAIAQLRALAQGESVAGGLYIAGVAATGKTHLLLAACAEAEAVGRRASYLPLAAAVGRMRDALDAVEHADLVALDGLEMVIGDRENELALFDAHNRARDAGRSLLYAARTIPDGRSAFALVAVRADRAGAAGRPGSCRGAASARAAPRSAVR